MVMERLVEVGAVTAACIDNRNKHKPPYHGTYHDISGCYCYKRNKNTQHTTMVAPIVPVHQFINLTRKGLNFRGEKKENARKKTCPRCVP